MKRTSGVEARHLRSGADARAAGRVPEYAEHMKRRLMGLGQTLRQAEAARRKIIEQFGEREAGQALVEYALIIAVMAVLLIPAIHYGLEVPLEKLMRATASSISQPPPSTPAPLP